MTHGPNLRLRALHTEADWTLHALAHAVNTIAAEAGTRRYYDRTSASHWLAGRHPVPGVPQALAEALSRRLHRPVTLADIGLPDPDDAPPTGDPVTDLAALAAADCDSARRLLLRQGIYQLRDTAVLPDPAPTARPQRPSHSRRVGNGEICAAQAMTTALAGVYQTHGGGRVRAPLAAYLALEVTSLLTRVAPTPAGRRFTSTAAGLVYLAGFLALDARTHRLAQRYLHLALAMTEDARNTPAQALVLRALGLQAHLLGHHSAALHIIQTAEATARHAAPAHILAQLTGQLAVAHATLGNRRDAIAHLTRTERHFDPATPQPGPLGTYGTADLHHDAGLTLYYLHDHTPALQALNLALEHRPGHQRLPRALTYAWTTRLHTDLHHLHPAHTALRHLRHDCLLLHSQRANHALTDLTRRITAQSRTIQTGLTIHRSPPGRPGGDRCNLSEPDHSLKDHGC